MVLYVTVPSLQVAELPLQGKEMIVQWWNWNAYVIDGTQPTGTWALLS
jgi:hypothetical protein